MSWFDTNSPSLIGSAGSLVGGIVSYFGNKSLQKQANEFNAQQAELNRQFQHQETELARDWQERFYNQYQSPEAMVRQYENAGINPVLAVGQPTNTPPSASGGSGSSASAVTPPYMNMVGVMEQVGKLAMLKAEIANINADTSLKGAQAVAADASAAQAYSQISLNENQIDKLKTDIILSAEQANSEKAKQALYAADSVLKSDEHKLFDKRANQFDLENFLLDWKKEYIKRYHHSPDQNALTILLDKLKPMTDVSEIIINDAGNFTNNVYNFAKRLIFGD